MNRIGGFSLIEVLVALTIAAVVVLAAHAVFVGVADGARAVTTARHGLDREANGRRWLKATFLSLDTPFDGRTDRVSFTSWQLTSGGWFAKQSTEIWRDGGELRARHGADTLRLRDEVTGVSFDYLLEPGAQTRWVGEWISPVTAPLALRLRIGGCGRRDAACVDTLLFLIRERG